MTPMMSGSKPLRGTTLSLESVLSVLLDLRMVSTRLLNSLSKRNSEMTLPPHQSPTWTTAAMWTLVEDMGTRVVWEVATLGTTLAARI